MSIIKTEQLVYEYTRYDDEGNPSGTSRALSGVDLEIQEGTFVAILGHNGSGKSTLAKHLNALFLPTEGMVWVDGMKTSDEGCLFEIRQRAGMVFQNPDNQIVGNIVEEDVGFGPENMGIKTDEIWNRVNAAINCIGLSDYRTRSPHHLSGGQKQRGAIAGILAMKPKCIILDEPTAMLDPDGRSEVIKTLHELNRKEGITMILITHYMEEVVDADRVIVMNRGEVIMEGTPHEIFRLKEELEACGLTVPQVTELAICLRRSGLDLPEAVLSSEEFLEAFRKLKGSGKAESIQSVNDADPLTEGSGSDEVLMELQGLGCTYQAGTVQAARAVEGVDLVIKRGEFIGLAGHTGSGKSSLIQHLNGLMKPTEGKVFYRGQDIWDKKSRKKSFFGKKKAEEERERLTMKFLRQRVGLVFQYPENQLFEETVLKDVEFGPKNLGMKEELAREAAVAALRQVGLDEKYFQVSPFDLSGGQKRRVAIAGVLAMNPEILILDEPTAGLDPTGREEILSALENLRKERNLTVLLVSHSMEDLAGHATRLVVMDHGHKVMDGPTREVFSRPEDLKKISLGVPQVTDLMTRLQREGLIRSDRICITVGEAAEQILNEYQ